MKPYVICHMIASLDGGLHPSRFTVSPQGDRKAWSEAYERIHDELDGDAWIVGRVTMAEMSKTGPHAPATYATPARPNHFATRTADSFAVALDPSGKITFRQARHRRRSRGGVARAGRERRPISPNSRAMGSPTSRPRRPRLDLAAMLETLWRELNIKRLLLEGGGGINPCFLRRGAGGRTQFARRAGAGRRAREDSGSSRADAGLAGAAQLSLTACERLDDGLLHLQYAVAKV